MRLLVAIDHLRVIRAQWCLPSHLISQTEISRHAAEMGRFFHNSYRDLWTDLVVRILLPPSPTLSFDSFVSLRSFSQFGHSSVAAPPVVFVLVPLFFSP